MKKWAVALWVGVLLGAFPFVGRTAIVSYNEDFIGPAETKVPGWMDETDNSDFNARIKYSTYYSYAKIIRTPESTWGKVLSPALVVNIGAVKDNDTLQIKVGSLSANASWTLGIQEMTAPWRHWFLQEDCRASGTFTFNYSNLAQMAPGAYTLAVEIIVGGGGDEFIEVDSLSVTNGDNPVYTATPTPTLSPTITPTPTMTSTPAPLNIWQDHFDAGAAGNQPAGWMDETANNDFNAEIALAGNSQARIQRTGEGTWGKVLSPALMVNVGTDISNDNLQIKIDNISSQTTWSLGIQEMVAPWRHWFLQEGSQGTGTFTYNYSALAQWAPGTYTFAVEVILDGAAGQNLTVDQVSVSGQSGSMIVLPTPTPTPVATWARFGQNLATDAQHQRLWTDLALHQGALCVGTLEGSPNRSACAWFNSGSGWENKQVLPNSPDTKADGGIHLCEFNGAPVASFTCLTSDSMALAMVSRYNGTSWAPLGTVSMLGNNDIDADQMAAHGQDLYLLCRYYVYNYGGPYPFESLIVSHWNGSGFEALGGSLNTPQMIDTMFTGSIACTDSGVLYAAHVEYLGYTHQISVKHWDGQAWQLDIASLNVNNRYNALSPQLATWGEQLFVTWSEAPDYFSVSQNYVKYWNGSDWQQLGGTLNLDPSKNVGGLRLAISPSGVPYVAIVQNGKLYVKYWNGTDWALDGDCLNLNPNLTAGSPSIIFSDTHAYVSWIESDNSTAWSLNAKSQELGAQGASVSGKWLLCPGKKTATATTTPTLTPTPPKPDATATFTATTTPTPTVTPWLAEQNVMVYPNPARDRVMFAYTVSGAANVTVDLYKITGERVAHIVEAKNGGAGQTLTTTWEAGNVAPGIYICRMIIRDGEGKLILEQKKKVALVK